MSTESAKTSFLGRRSGKKISIILKYKYNYIYYYSVLIKPLEAPYYWLSVFVLLNLCTISDYWVAVTYNMWSNNSNSRVKYAVDGLVY